MSPLNLFIFILGFIQVTKNPLGHKHMWNAWWPHCTLIYQWPNKTQILSTGSVYETPYITLKFIPTQSLVWNSGLLSSCSQYKSELGSICWHLFPDYCACHDNFFIIRVPLVLTQHTSNCVKDIRENRRRHLSIHVGAMLQSKIQLFQLQRIQQESWWPWREIGPLQWLFLWSFSSAYGHGHD